jgi:hypothetical protein
VNDLRDGADEPERIDRPERRRPGGSGADLAALRERIEPRSRAEYAADLKQQVVSGWDRRSSGPRMREPLDGAEGPKVRAALTAEFIAREVPRVVSLPVTELVGAEGHRYCTGWQLHAVDGDMKSARDQRAVWVRSRVKGGPPDVPEPRARPVDSLEGGVIVFAFGPNGARNGYEISTMYPRQREEKYEGDTR